MSSTPAAVPPVHVPAGATASQALADAGLPRSGPQAPVVVRDAAGRLRDLAWSPPVGSDVDVVVAASPDGRDVIRHSTAHVLAQAVQDLFPGAQLGIGPFIRGGFYYDFDVETPFTPEDLVAIERRMRQIVKSGQRFFRRAVDRAEARVELAGQPYKLELIDDRNTVGDDAEIMEIDAESALSGQLTMYDNLHAHTGERLWTDLCRGPHVPTTRAIPAFAITRSSAAYWRGDQNNAALQRIYGTAWESGEALDAYRDRLAEAERRDHRRLGVELDLFSFPDEIGSGLAVFHPRGGLIRLEMEQYSRMRHIQAGYEFVNTPHITKGRLFEISGHLQWFADGMYPPMHLDAEFDAAGEQTKPGQDYYLKPMNCPMHNLIFAARGRSYRELPLRLFEFGTVYRYEPSGVIHGLTRARGFTQDDAHIYCTLGQLRDELASLLQFVLALLRDYGLDDFYLELSTRNPDKCVGTEQAWQVATDTLADVAASSGLELVPDPGGAAFYGPKISVQARDAIGRTWQMSTIQLDFNLPERFGLEYTAPDGSRQRPVMIHRALFGSIERFFAVLIEHYAGAFPAWLSPVQVVGIPVADAFAGHLEQVMNLLRVKVIRAEVDRSDDRMQKKIRNHTTGKVPFLLLAGQADVDAGAVSFRFRDGSQLNGVPVADAVDAITDWISRRDNRSPSAALLEPEPLTDPAGV